MKNKISIPKELLITIDVNNTVNGGASQPKVQVTNKEDGYHLKLNTPGVEADGLQVEIVKNKLYIFHNLPVFGQRFEDEEIIQSPRFLANVTIPHDVDMENITARFDESIHKLVVFMPYNHLHDDFRRTIEIERW
jgi:HSP20 family molecular chaperone IbpA